MQLTPTADRHANLIGMLVQHWQAWGDSRDSLSALDACGRDETERMAHDLSLTPSELRSLVRKGSDAASELYRRLADLGLDRDALARDAPPILRDMQKNCSLCGSKARCRRDLARGADPSAWYCPNDDALGALAPGGASPAWSGTVAAAASAQNGKRRSDAFLLGLLFIGLWAVLLAGLYLEPRRSPALMAPAAATAPTGAGITCLDASCLDAGQLAALRDLRAIQSQGMVASSAQLRAIIKTASLTAQDIRVGEAFTCARQDGTTYYGFMFDSGCSEGGHAAAKREGYKECHPMAGGGACLLP